MVIRVGRGFSMNAGLRPGDMIRSVNGREIRTVRDLVAAIGGGSATWQVTILRNGQPVTANFRL